MAGPLDKGNRAYPSIPAITGDVDNHTRALQLIKAALETHERRTRNLLDSFVRLRELVDTNVFQSYDGQVVLDNILEKLVTDQIIVEKGPEELHFILTRLHRIIVAGTPDNPQLAWDDYIAALVSAQGVGGTVPDWTTFRDGIKAYEFDDAAMNQLWLNIHLTHDYAVGTLMYPHIHWSPNTTSTGTVRWGVEYTIAKGHNQESFPASTTIYLEDTISANSQYEHRIIEATDAQAFNSSEADSMVLIRMFRDATHGNDTFPDPVHAFQLDLHYQKNRYGTISRIPSFDET